MRTLHSPTMYFPDLLTMSLIASCGTWLVEAQEHYQKNDIRNRCYIRSKNGLQSLSIPLEKRSKHLCPIREVTISYHEAWPRKHWQAIQTAYGSAPYFEHYAHLIQNLYHDPGQLLWDFNERAMNLLHTILLPGIQKQSTENYLKPTASSILDRRTYDIRHTFYSKAQTHMPDFVQLPGFTEAFAPSLSSLDLLFFCGPYGRSWLENSGKNIINCVSEANS
jgi:hypothetical protein